MVFTSPEDAQRAIEVLNEKELFGRRMFVREDKEDIGSRGIGMGGESMRQDKGGSKIPRGKFNDRYDIGGDGGGDKEKASATDSDSNEFDQDRDKYAGRGQGNTGGAGRDFQERTAPQTGCVLFVGNLRLVARVVVVMVVMILGMWLEG